MNAWIRVSEMYKKESVSSAVRHLEGGRGLRTTGCCCFLVCRGGKMLSSGAPHVRFSASFSGPRFLKAAECTYVSSSLGRFVILPWTRSHHLVLTPLSLPSLLTSPYLFLAHAGVGSDSRRFASAKDTEDWWRLFQSAVSSVAPSSPSLSPSALVSLSLPPPALRKVGLSYCG